MLSHWRSGPRSTWPARLRTIEREAEHLLEECGVLCVVEAYRVTDAGSSPRMPLLLVLRDLNDPQADLAHLRATLVRGLNRRAHLSLRWEDLLISVNSPHPAQKHAPPQVKRAAPVSQQDFASGSHGMEVVLEEDSDEVWHAFKPTDLGPARR